MTTPQPPALRRPRASLSVLVLVLAGLLAAGTSLSGAALAATAAFVHPTPTTIPDHIFVVGNHGGGITVPDSGPATPYPSATSLSGATGAVTDVDVYLNGISHDYPADLDVMLVAPDGQRVLLMSDVGGVNPVYDRSLSFDDQAASSLTALNPLANGSFRPTNAPNGPVDSFPAPAPSAAGAAGTLASLNGIDPNGTWNLYVVDDAVGDSGTIAHGWSIRVTTDATANPYPSALQVSGVTGPVTDVDLELSGLNHNYVGDLDILLEAPDGRRALVMSDVGSGRAVGADVLLDDEAGAPLPDTGDLTSGRYSPLDITAAYDADSFPAPAPTLVGVGSALSVFDGADPNGTWRLFIVDDAPIDAGTLAGWSLHISTADAPTPTPTPDPVVTTPAPATRDQIAPRVASTLPVPGGHAKVGADLPVRFSEAVRKASVTKTSVFLVRIGHHGHLPASLTYRSGTHTVTIDPGATLRHHARYRVTVTTAVSDLPGNRLDQAPGTAGAQPAVWTFRTR
jgi:subtilisin-like proprotein convertase family protein